METASRTVALSVDRFHELLKKHGVGCAQGSLPAAQIVPSSCESDVLTVRRSESIVANSSAKQYIDTTRFFTSASTVDDATAAGRSPATAELRSTTPSAADSPTTSFECRSAVDEEAIAVNWTALRLVFVLLDVLLLVHRLTKLYVELNRMRLSVPIVGGFSSLSDGCVDGISILPIDGVDPAQAICEHESAELHIGNCVAFEARDDDDEVTVGESTSNSLCATSERCCSNNVSSTATRRRATGSRWTRRRRTRSSPDIVPRLVCLVALLVALFYARTSTTSRGVLWLRGALPSVVDKSPSISTSAIGRHYYDDVGIDSLSSDFRQLQAFVDFFNRGKFATIFHEALSASIDNNV